MQFSLCSSLAHIKIEKADFEKRSIGMHSEKCTSKTGRAFMCPRLSDSSDDRFCCGLDHCCTNQNLSTTNVGIDSGKNDMSPWFAGIATVYLIFVFLLIGRS